ncbi:MAG: universal stress protein [Sulfolobaceae archaeon]|nr:universal stress protein [Sulfolobaceae archaeon]
MTEPSYKVSFWMRKILVPVDGSENSMRALDLAVDFGMRYGSKVTITYICEYCERSDEIKEAVEKRIESRISYNFKVVKFSTRESSVANELLKIISDEGYDTIIMGAKGSSINIDTNIGSTALSIAVNAPITVIIVR